MTALAAALTVLAALTWTQRPLRRQLATVLGRTSAATSSRGPRLSQRTVFHLAASLCGIGVCLAIGQWWGIVPGIGIAVLGPRLLARLESRADRERRHVLHRQSADCADLLAACLVSGAPVTTAVDAVARSLGEPIATPLQALVTQMRWGADGRNAWSTLASDPCLGPLARAVVRSLESGAPLANLLPGIADDLRRDAAREAQAAARSAGVRAVAPLAACFLPAFFLLGVVPVVVSLVMPFLTGGPFG